MTTWRQARRWMAWGGAALGVAALWLALTAPATAQAPVQLRFMSWYFGEDPAGPALKALFAEFEKKNPNIKVVAEQVTSAERVPKFTAAMEAGRGPDIYMDTPPNAPNLIARGYCANLEPLMKAEKEDIKARFTKGDLDSFTDEKGDHYFLPYSTGPMGLIYNAKAFQDAGLDPEPAAPDLGGAARLLEEADQGQPVRDRPLRQGRQLERVAPLVLVDVQRRQRADARRQEERHQQPGVHRGGRLLGRSLPEAQGRAPERPRQQLRGEQPAPRPGRRGHGRERGLAVRGDREDQPGAQGPAARRAHAHPEGQGRGRAAAPTPSASPRAART